ncbi:MAG: BCCT family transporter, partial [Pseudomonadales bacterium]
MDNPLKGERAANIDWFIFIASTVIIVAVCIPLGLYPQAGAHVLNDAFVYVTEELGIVYILFSMVALGFLLYLAFSRFGDVKFFRDINKGVVKYVRASLR